MIPIPKNLTIFRYRYFFLSLSTQLPMKYLISLSLLLFCFAYSYAQQPTQEEIDDLLDEFLLEEDEDLLTSLLELQKQQHFIYLTANYNSNTYFGGRAGSQDQYNASAQASYFHSSGFFGSLSELYLEKADPKFDTFIFSVGYGTKINSTGTLRFTGSYSRFFFANSENAVFENNLDAGISARTKNRLLGTSLNASFLFGENATLQTTFRIYSQLKLITKDNWDIKFRPRFSLLGSIQEVATAVNTTDFFDPDTNASIIVGTEFEDKFKFFNSNFYFPLQLNTRNWDFEVGFLLNRPFEIDATENNLGSKGLFQFSIGYLFGF